MSVGEGGASPGAGAVRDGRAHPAGRVGPPRGARWAGVRRVVTAGCRREDGDEGGDLLGRGVSADETQRRPSAPLVSGGLLVGAHSGMFPCFFGGRVWRLLRSARSARVTFIRVFDGEMTVSM